MGILEQLYDSEVMGQDDRSSPGYAEIDASYQALYDVVHAYIPEGNNEADNQFFCHIHRYGTARANQAFQRGIKFAVSFLIAAMEPPQKN